MKLTSLVVLILCSLIFSCLEESPLVENKYDESATIENPCPTAPFNNSCPGGELLKWLNLPSPARPALAEQGFSTQTLSQQEAEALSETIHQDFQARLEQEHNDNWQNRELQIAQWRMPFYFQRFGSVEFGKRSLYISMHGGGGAPSEVNDEQYNNQQNLYDRTMQNLEGIYLAPRAPEDASDMWYKDYIDDFFDLIIQLAVLHEGVDPNRVYLTGYSAGGDGVYQLAPRMADRWAAAAMMAGHPNAAHPYSLANTPFVSYVGAQDTGYDRNKKAAEWGDWMAQLQSEQPALYTHSVNILEGYGHWMELQDSPALSWMHQFTRDPLPKRIHWQQTTQTREHFYWLSIPSHQTTDKKKVTIELIPEANQIDIIEAYSDELTLWLNDEMLDLDEIITVTRDEQVIFESKAQRTILSLFQSLERRSGGDMIFSSKLEL